VTEFCTYGSLFDFLHSMDWMVTDERMSMLSASVQSWATDRMSHVSQTGQASSNSTESTQHTQSLPDGQSVSVPPPPPSSIPGPAPMIQSTDSSTWPVFTQLVTPPPSPAPSPAVITNPKRNSLGGAVQNLFMRPPALMRDRSDRAEHDLEKGSNELSGMGASSPTHASGSSSSSISSGSSHATPVGGVQGESYSRPSSVKSVLQSAQKEAAAAAAGESPSQRRGSLS